MTIDSAAESIPLTVAEMLDELKTRHGLSWREVGRQTSLSDRMIDRWAKGRGAEPPDYAALRIARLHRRYKLMPSSGLHKVG